MLNLFKVDNKSTRVTLINLNTKDTEDTEAADHRGSIK